MKIEQLDSQCVICGVNGSVTIDPPRRTLARESADPSFAIIAVLPDVTLCEEHAEEISNRQVVLGWCDDEGCRGYGEARQTSPCGAPYKELQHH
jgi:hypothetical protein